KERLAQLADTEGARVVVDADESTIHVDATFRPGGGAASAVIASMRPADTEPLLGGPDGPLTLLFRDDAAGRAQTAAAVESDVAEAPPLGDDPKIAGALKALGPSVTFAAVVQPLKLDPKRASAAAAPIVVGYGTKEGKLWIHLDVSEALVREITKSRMGL